MPNVTIPGSANFRSGFSLPVSSQQAAIIGQQAVAAIVASMNAGKGQEVFPSAPATINLPLGTASVTSIVDNGTAPLTVNNDVGASLTIVSGLGGLTYNVLDGTTPPVGNLFIDAGGGPSSINLASGTATVVADGVATVNAIFGGDTVFATAGGAASINAGAGATVFVAGTDTVGFYGPNANVFTQNGANLLVVGPGRFVLGSDPGPGVAVSSVTVAALGSFSQFEYVGYNGNIAVDASAGGKNVLGNAGSIFIDPRNTNITIFAGAGAETLWGTGDAGGTALSSGNVVVNSGNGWFHGGAGANLLETSNVAGAATLLGGSTTSSDALFVQGAWDFAIGDANTKVIDASGQSGLAGGILNFTFQGVAVGAGGNILNAGWAKQISIYGAAGGANTIISGTGASTVVGNHGVPGAANVYLDGEGRSGVAGGSITISDFIVGTDKFLLNGAVVMQPVPTGGSSTVTLSDGTKVTLTNVLITAANQTSIFS